MGERGLRKTKGKLMVDREVPATTHHVYVLVTWDVDRDDQGHVKDALPLVRYYEDRTLALEVYREAVAIRDYAYLYVTDEMGNFNIILELD